MNLDFVAFRFKKQGQMILKLPFSEDQLDITPPTNCKDS